MSSTTGLASECGRDYFRTLTVVINGLSQRCAAGTAKEQAGAQRKDHGLVYGVCQFAAPIGPFQLRPPPGLTPQRSLARSRNEGGCWCPAPAATPSNAAINAVLRWWSARTWRTVSSQSAASPARR